MRLARDDADGCRPVLDGSPKSRSAVAGLPNLFGLSDRSTSEVEVVTAPTVPGVLNLDAVLRASRLNQLATTDVHGDVVGPVEIEHEVTRPQVPDADTPYLLCLRKRVRRQRNAAGSPRRGGESERSQLSGGLARSCMARRPGPVRSERRLPPPGPIRWRTRGAALRCGRSCRGTDVARSADEPSRPPWRPVRAARPRWWRAAHDPHRADGKRPSLTPPVPRRLRGDGSPSEPRPSLLLARPGRGPPLPKRSAMPGPGPKHVAADLRRGTAAHRSSRRQSRSQSSPAAASGPVLGANACRTPSLG